MMGMLEVGGRNQHGVNVVARVERLVVGHGCDGVAGQLPDVCGAVFAAHLPNVRDGDELEVHLLGRGEEGRDVASAHAVATAHHAHADTIVGADNLGVAARSLSGGDGQSCSAELDEVSPGGVLF